MLLTFAAGWVAGRLGIGSVVAPASLTDLERDFREQMAGATLVGQFTVAGRDIPPRPDRYEIESVEKVGDDRWRFNARIRPGGLVLPIVVPMRWVGDTPVIVITRPQYSGGRHVRVRACSSTATTTPGPGEERAGLVDTCWKD